MHLEMRKRLEAELILGLGKKRVVHQLSLGTLIPFLNFIIINSPPGIKSNTTKIPHHLTL